MATTQLKDTPNTGDALIDEIRGIRREVCRPFGNDVDGFFDHLREVEQDYAARRGAFADVTTDAAKRITESWGETVFGTVDATVADVDETRNGPAERPT